MGIVEEATAAEGGAGIAEIAGIVTVGEVLVGMAEGKVLLVATQSRQHHKICLTCFVYLSYRSIPT